MLRLSFADERRIIEMAAIGTSVKEAATILKISAKAVEGKARRLGISVSSGKLRKRYAGPSKDCRA